MDHIACLALLVALSAPAWAQGPSPSPTAGPSPLASPRPALRFRAMDRDQDGVITRDEWSGNDSSFRNHDCDGDGVLSGDELKPGAAPCPGRGRRRPGASPGTSPSPPASPSPAVSPSPPASPSPGA